MASIGISKPTYNQEVLIEDVIENMIECSSDDVRFYVRDDCSTDGTYSKLKQSESKNIAVAVNEKNIGARENTVRILKQITEDYVGFSAGDDFLCPDALIDAGRILREHSPDIIFFKIIRVPSDRALSVSRLPDGAFNKTINNPLIRNAEIGARKWSGACELLEACAVYPGLVWMQGAIIRRSLATEAGFLQTGTVDDWGLLHNLAMISRSRHLSFIIRDKVLAVTCVSPDSLGNDPVRQLRSQIEAIDRYWANDLKKTALLNVMKKKIRYYEQSELDYRHVVDCFAHLWGKEHFRE